MAHNGYFYPEDIVVEFVNGVRTARIGLELPAIWTEQALNAANKIDYLTGWEMARRAHDKREHDEWYARVYSRHHAENLRFRDHLAKGLSVCSFYEADKDWRTTTEEQQND